MSSWKYTLSMSESDLPAREWLRGFLDHHGIKWDTLTKAQQFLMTREIPCTIRCWRVGGPVDVRPGEECSECGKPVPLKTSWELIPFEPPPV